MAYENEGRCPGCGEWVEDRSRCGCQTPTDPAPQPTEEPTPEGRIIDEWERIEGESMREGHRATLERLIAAAFASRLREITIDADHDWALWFEKWRDAVDLMGRQAARADAANDSMAGMKATCEAHKSEQTRLREVAEARLRAVEQERDEARLQQYPTVEAYEMACAALQKYHDRAERAEADLVAAVERLGGKP